MKPPSEYSAAAGTAPDEIEVDQLYRESAPALRCYFRNRLRDRDAADDMVQETFLRLAGNGDAATIRNPAAWLQRVARNLIFDRTRKAKATRIHLHVPIEEADLPPVRPDQSDRLEACDLLDRYEEALGMLSERTAQIFLLHRLDELSYREIASRLGISVATVEYHMMRALAHFDRVLGDQ